MIQISSKILTISCLRTGWLLRDSERVFFLYGTHATEVWLLYEIVRWPLFRGLVTVEVYVSSIQTRAFGHYIADVRCSGVAAKRGFTEPVISKYSCLLSVACVIYTLYRTYL